MVLYQVHKECHYTKYFSTVCSRATLFQVTIILVILIAPFFISYSTNDFWQRTSTYVEQPKVHFLNQWIIQLTTDDTPVPKSWSTYAGLNRFLLDSTDVSIPVVKFREEDYSFDQINDKLIMTINYTNQDLNVTAVELLLFFELQFTLFATVIVKSAVHVSSSWSVPSSRLWVSGDLLLYQRAPLPSSGRVTKYNTSFFNDSSFTTSDYELTNVLRQVHERNVSTVLSNSHSVWQSGASGTFTIDIELTYPRQTVTYSPGFWQLVKFAWIQYLAILVIFYYVLNCVRNFVFENRIILTVKLNHDKHL